MRAGLIARLCYAEAAGWLAHSHAWVHPLDLSLRAAGLTASTALAAVGRGHRSLPQTFAGTADPRAWADPPFDTLADGDRAVAEALALARLLRRLAGQRGATGFASATAALGSLQGLGAGWLDGAAFIPWWAAVAPQPQARQRSGGRAGDAAEPPLPALLIAAHAAHSWMESGITATPTPAQALLLATGLIARTGAVRAVVLPVWAAYPAVGFSGRDTLPGLRSDAADRLVGRGRPVTWPLAFLHLVAESARMGAARAGSARDGGRDRAGRLPQTWISAHGCRTPSSALLRAPVLTPKALAAQLEIAPQTGTALLRELQGRGVVREVTGRGSFRAFAI